MHTSSEEGSQKSFVLLSVDDEENVLRSIKRTLRKLDLEVITTTSGSEALEIMKSRQVDVLLSDMRMPEMSGPDLLSEAAEQYPDVCRIALTGYADPEDTLAAINQGAVWRYINKPWDDDDLRAVIQQAAEMGQLRRENQRLAELTAKQNEELESLNKGLEARIAQRTRLLTRTLEELDGAYSDMIDLVANIAALPNPERRHARVKVELAQTIGEALNLPADRMKVLLEATRLHRIGFVGLPERFRNMCVGDMNQAERTEYRQNPVLASAVLMGFPRLEEVAKVVGTQFERLDGLGFPAGIAADQISKEARILAVARDYVEAQLGRIEGEPMSASSAIAFIKNHADARYDPEVVEVLEQCFGEFTVAGLVTSESVAVEDLVPSMVLAEDLLNDKGVVLLAKGFRLTPSAIKSLHSFELHSDEVLSVMVEGKKVFQ